MKVVVLDGEAFSNEAQAHTYLADKLCFPSHYGNNLDALHDCLGDIGEETQLVIYHRCAWRLALGEKVDLWLQILAQSEMENPLLVLSYDAEDFPD